MNNTYFYSNVLPTLSETQRSLISVAYLPDEDKLEQTIRSEVVSYLADMGEADPQAEEIAELEHTVWSKLDWTESEAELEAQPYYILRSL